MSAYTRLRGGMIRRERDRAILPPDADTLDAREFRAAVAADPSCVADEPAPALTEGDCKAAIQAALDAHAQSWGYDGIVSGCTYATSRKPQWQAEGQALVDWRDAVWDRGNEILAQQLALIAAGKSPTITSLADLLALLPAPPSRPSA